ncbi:SAVED domain-containing protein, partial [Clostridium perfringens]|uniref:SAVED domain-containing protein n=1 Tax=Clostridium perfringens TaxID=1502 RepID=UPI0032DB32DA
MNALICRQDSEIKSFKNRINHKFNYGYMGIAHTPLILRFGSQLGDGINLIPMHKKRNEKYYSLLKNKSKFTELVNKIMKKSDEIPNLKIIKKNLKKESKELIVAISTTNEIKEYQLYELGIKEKNLVMFQSDKLDFDVIESKVQLNDYIDIVLRNMREIIKNNNIEKTHLVISSSVAFTLALGQRLTNSYDREIIIYNYGYIPAKDNESKAIYYPWGINLFKDGIDCVIKNI